jgi:dephospho-CoA kinase
MRVGLSGGVGSGKSTVAQLLADHGAVVIDADAIAREVVEPGTPGFDAVVSRFGEHVVVDGRLDRAALARIVFSDEQARADLNAIVHPLVGQRSEELAAAAPPGAIVVNDVPLLVESGRTEPYDLVVIVIASEQVRLARLAARGMDEADARSRIAAQANDEQRVAAADVLIQNDGTLDELTRQVNALWERLAGG